MKIFLSIAKVAVVLGTFVGSLFGVHQQAKLGNSVPVPYAVFETYLATGISNSDTSMTLANGTDNGGNILKGYICFTVDQGTASQEFICGTASSTAITALQRGINTFGGTSTVATLQFSHRRGADVKITDWPILGIITNKITGVDGFDSALTYTTHPCTAGSASNTICDKNYSDSLANQGAATATNLIAGITKLSVAAASANNPIVVGDNDTRIPTSGQASALSGTSGTPGSTNKYVTNNDTSTTSTTTVTITAGSIVRYKTNGELTASTTPVVASDAASKAYVDAQNYITGLGAWTTATQGAATQVTKDGFLVGWVTVPNNNFNTTSIISDSSNPPTTVIQNITGGSFGTNGNIPFMIPVRKNDYYLITVGASHTVTASFIPIGI